MHLSLKKLWASLVIGSLIFSSCSGKEANNQLETINFLLDWVPNTNHTGLYVAQEKGFFAENGLKVNILQAPESGAVDLLIANKAQFAISDQSSITKAIDGKLPIIGVAAILQRNDSAFASLKEKNITRPRDFEGKRYMGWGGAVEEATIKTLVTADGGDASKVDFIPAINLADLSALTLDQADLIWLFHGWDGIAAEVNNIAINEVFLRDYRNMTSYTPIIISTTSYITASHETAQKFMDAAIKGYYYAAKNPEEAAKILVKYNPGLSLEMTTKSQQYLANNFLTAEGEFGVVDADHVDQYTQWLYDHKLIKNLLTSDQIFTNELLANQVKSPE